MKQLSNFFVVSACVLLFSMVPLAERPALTGNIPADMLNMLPAGKIKASMMEIAVDQREYELGEKLMRKTNPDWLHDYMEGYEPGVKPPYHKNFGLTEEEYDEYWERLNEIKFEPTDEEEITISLEDSVITFTTSEKGIFKFLNNVQFDARLNQVTCNKETLISKGPLKEDSDTMLLGSTSSGYKWGNENREPGVKGYFKLSSFSVLRLDKTGETVIQFVGAEYLKKGREDHIIYHIRF